MKLIPPAVKDMQALYSDLILLLHDTHRRIWLAGADYNLSVTGFIAPWSAHLDLQWHRHFPRHIYLLRLMWVPKGYRLTFQRLSTHRIEVVHSYEVASIPTTSEMMKDVFEFAEFGKGVPPGGLLEAFQRQLAVAKAAADDQAQGHGLALKLSAVVEEQVPPVVSHPERSDDFDLF